MSSYADSSVPLALLGHPCDPTVQNISHKKGYAKHIAQAPARGHHVWSWCQRSPNRRSNASWTPGSVKARSRARAKTASAGEA